MQPAEVPIEAIQDLAAREKVCVRPLLRRVVDTVTGESAMVALPCQSTRESRCPSCAAKARELRVAQCREGWHLEEEPADPEPTPSPDEADAPPEEQPADERTQRSTRRRDDAPDLPRLPQEDRTVGQAYEGKNGRVYRPSMFITLTLPGYGSIVPGEGVPVDPSRYDYRRAALDALHFPKLLDRWFQNLRRCAGYKVQYFGAVEAQRRLAPHFHVATRGALPRWVVKAVTRATYVNIWWPQMDRPVFTETAPEWDGIDYVSPTDGEPLKTWEEALDELERDDAGPSHTMRFGRQVDIKGLVSGTPDADRSVRYLTKYLTKAIGETYTDADSVNLEYEAHIDRLHAEVRWLPCSPECANWLRFGVQPRHAGPGLIPGWCPSKAHDRDHLGLGGRRVLVSRKWSGKTLSQHKADRAAVVREALEAAGIEVESAQRMAASVATTDGQTRYEWATVVHGSAITAEVIMQGILERRRWRKQYDEAKALIQGVGPPVDSHSATGSRTGEGMRSHG